MIILFLRILIGTSQEESVNAILLPLSPFHPNIHQSGCVPRIFALRLCYTFLRCRYRNAGGVGDTGKIIPTPNNGQLYAITLMTQGCRAASAPERNASVVFAAKGPLLPVLLE